MPYNENFEDFNIGDDIIYRGDKIVRKYFIIKDNYKKIHNGGIYKIFDILQESDGYYYFRIFTDDMSYWWFPVECFIRYTDKSYVSNKYNLK